VNLKPNSFKFPPFLELTNSDVTSLISHNYLSFPDRSTIMQDKKQWFYHSNISAMLRPISFETLEYVYFILDEYIDLKWKKKYLNFRLFDL